jgi:uncharacterized coiled-coil protein SlyX
MTDRDRRGRRTPPAGVPTLIEDDDHADLDDDDRTPPPSSLYRVLQQACKERHRASLHQAQAALEMSSANRDRLIALTGEDGRNGIVGGTREVVKRQGDAIDALCDQLGEVEPMARAARQIALESEERLVNRVHSLEERMSEHEKGHAAEKTAAAVNSFKVKMVWGVVVFAAIALGQVVINRFVAVAAPPPAASGQP